MGVTSGTLDGRLDGKVSITHALSSKSAIFAATAIAGMPTVIHARASSIRPDLFAWSMMAKGTFAAPTRATEAALRQLGAPGWCFCQ